MNMAAGAIAPPEWLYPQASVLLLEVHDCWEVRAVRSAIVESIAPKSCVVRFRIRGVKQTTRVWLADLKTGDQSGGGTWDPRWHYELVDADSERGQLAMRLRSLWTAQTAVREAAAAVAKDANNLDALDALRRAVDAWRPLLETDEMGTVLYQLRGCE